MSTKFKDAKEFYKAQNGEDVDYESLSGLEKANNETALSAYNQKNFLEETYGKALQEAETAKLNQERSAYFQNQKLLKYLPQNLKQQGFGGLGVSNQAYLDANNNYNNTLANINSDYNTNKNNLMQNYNQGVLEIEENTKAEKRANEADFYTRSQNSYNDIYANLGNMLNSFETNGSGKYEESDMQKLKDYVEKYGNNLDKDYKNMLNAYIESLAESQMNTDDNETNNRILEGKEFINYNGNDYKLKSQLDINSNEIAKNRDFKNQLKEKFGTTNPYDLKIPNGTTLAIKCDSSGANEFNFIKDVMGIDYSDWKALLIPGYNFYNMAKNVFNFETRYVTYYNGEWYLSEKK